MLNFLDELGNVDFLFVDVSLLRVTFYLQCLNGTLALPRDIRLLLQ